VLKMGAAAKRGIMLENNAGNADLKCNAFPRVSKES